MADGIFAQWQPRYAEAGIPTFPVNPLAKKPAINGYMKVGQNGSRELVAKFGNAEAIGFRPKRAGLTILDVDSPDERLFADALAEFGNSPVIVQSGSGNFQAWFRYNGERRKVRPDKSKPIDILAGGMVIAPPSRGAKGGYRFLSGSLDDLQSLPVLRLPDAPSEAETATPAIAAIEMRNDARNASLFTACLRAARLCDDLESLMQRAAAINGGFADPLDADELAKVAGNAWKYQVEGKNRVGQEQAVQLSRSEVMALVPHPDALALLSLLRLRNWDRKTFIVANEMAATMPPDGWHRKRFAAARADLMQLGFLQQVRAPSQANGAAIYRFT